MSCQFCDSVSISSLDLGFLFNRGIVHDSECHDNFSFVVNSMLYVDVSSACQEQDRAPM